jgi:hypothetical protein
MIYNINYPEENDMHGNKINLLGYVWWLSSVENHILVQITNIYRVLDYPGADYSVCGLSMHDSFLNYYIFDS